jgi:uncharacterized protein (TIGR00730 family)
MNSIRSICLFCGASPGADPSFAEAAKHFGETLAARNIAMIYGGGSVGLMGIAADACLARGGRVVGVIPRLLMEREVGHAGITEMHVVEDMHQRKALMTSLCDGFIALPGGYGTLDELFEALTWLQLNYHVKPVGLLNVSGFFDGLIRFLDHARDARFLRPMHRDALCVETDLDRLIVQLESANPPLKDKWLDRATLSQE